MECSTDENAHHLRSPPKGKVTSEAKNRRLAYMYRLRKEAYFHADAIVSRHPLIYEAFMGNTRPPSYSISDEKSSLSSVFMRQSDRMAMKELLERQRAEAEEAKSEHNSDDEQHEEEEKGEANKDEDEKLLGLIREMEERFLAGLDDFDYQQIDLDESLDGDLLEQEGRDKEDAYFDQGEEGEEESIVGERERDREDQDAPEEWETMMFD